MKFKKFITEILKSWVYSIPSDKEQVLYDFYMIVSLPSPNDEDLSYILKETRDKIVEWLMENFQDALKLAVSAEFRHIFDMNNNIKIREFFNRNHFENFILGYAQRYGLYKANFKDFSDEERSELAKKMKASDTDYIESLKAVESGLKKQNSDWPSFMKMAAKSFRELHWQSSFGGEPWAMIADGFLRLVDAKTYGDKIVAIDHVYDLQHNTGTVFTKVKEYYKSSSGYHWLKGALDKKREIKDLYEIYYDTSPQLRRFVPAVIKDAEGRTLEDWLKSKEKEEEKTKEKPVLKVGDQIKVKNTDVAPQLKGKNGFVVDAVYDIETDKIFSAAIYFPGQDIKGAMTMKEIKGNNWRVSSVEDVVPKSDLNKKSFYVLPAGHIEKIEEPSKKENPPKVGETVEAIDDIFIDDKHSIPKGTKGKLVAYDTPTSYGVDWKKDVGGHTLNGKTEKGHGWWVDLTEIKSVG